MNSHLVLIKQFLPQPSASPGFFEVKLPVPEGKKGEKKLRIVVVSDSHNELQNIKIPDGDIFIHCGDFTHKYDWKQVPKGEVSETVRKFNELIGKLPHKYKIVISGNHEIGFNHMKRKEIQKALSNCIYLEDTEVVIEGIKIYGTPWTSSTRMAFSCPRDKLEEKWKKIPEDTDILVSHLPPSTIMDLAANGAIEDVTDPKEKAKRMAKCELCNKVHPNHRHWGSKSLLQRVVEEVKPTVHLFGHVHERTGVKQLSGITFINAAVALLEKPIVFDYYLSMRKSAAVNGKQE